MKIIIDNRDLQYSIDTYGMFTGDGADEIEYSLSDEQLIEAIEANEYEFNEDAALKEKDNG